FEGRINPDVKMNYLASPPLVVAYALAGSMDVDITTEPLGTGKDGEPVYLSDIWPSAEEIQAVMDHAIASDMYQSVSSAVFAGDDRWRAAHPHRQHLRVGGRRHLRPQASVLRGHGSRTGAGHRHLRCPRPGQAR